MKINEQLIRHEIEMSQSLKKPALELYRYFSSKECPKGSYHVFYRVGKDFEGEVFAKISPKSMRLEDRDK